MALLLYQRDHCHLCDQALAALAAARAPDAPTRPPSWGRAARLEHIGQAPLSSARDARLTHRPSGALPPVATRADA